MGINKLTGTPWHTEKVHRAENDDRRYKGRCKYYSYEKDNCSKYFSTCRGSAHCDHYKAISEEEFKKRQKKHQRTKRKSVKTKEDDSYWF